MATITTTDRYDVDALPTPTVRPDVDVLIFDGHCRMCRKQIGILARWFAGHRLAYLSLHNAEVAQRYPDLSHDDLMRQMYVVEPNGTRHGGAAAVRYLSRRLPRLWWLAPLLHLPGTMPVWNWLYGQVASRRYLFGRLETCDDGSCSLHR